MNRLHDAEGQAGIDRGSFLPQEAATIADYYCSPPRPMKTAYIAAGSILDTIRNGIPTEKNGNKEPNSEELDDLIEMKLAQIAKANMVMDVGNMSLADLLRFYQKLADKLDEIKAAVGTWMPLHGGGDY